MLRHAVAEVGETDWKEVAKRMPGRNSRQCRERWRGYLQPNLSMAPWSCDEDQLLLKKYSEYGPKWSYIRQFLPDRSETSIKNRWKAISGVNRGVVFPVPVPLAPVYPMPAMHGRRFVADTVGMEPCHVLMQPPVVGVAGERQNCSSESSPETSACEKETLNTRQELEAFFKSLSLSHLRNGRK